MTRQPLAPRPLLCGLVTAALLAVGCAPSPSGEERQPAERPLAVIYDGPQGCPDCAPSIAKVLRKAPQHFRVRYVKAAPKASDLAGAKLYVQPGGGSDLERTWRDLKGSAGVVRTWVRNGGGYLGLCFGAYLAGRHPGFGLLPGDTNGYIDSPSTTVPDGRDTVVPVKWKGKPRHMYFQDGPAFYLNEDADADVLATYPNGDAAVVVAPYGKGRVGVSGPHPEADESWYAEKGLHNPDGILFDLAHELIEATTGRR
ncbi:BPL-N domain-containing protein [Streptomyces sp. NBUL23]|uniref:BPL-N domain-containing protein n=1 Tax=Streptomyces sp. NBUL23 TaxID=3381354 RepID=UPI0038720998